MAHEDLGFQESSPHDDLVFVSDDDVAANRKATLDAGLDHFSNSATLGYLPQIEGGLTSAALKASDLVNGTHNADLVPYTKLRDETSDRLAQDQARHPVASGVGMVGGALTTGVGASALAPIKAATWAGRALQAGGVAGAMGALENPGDKEGEVSPVQAGDRVKNALMAAPLGAGASMGADALSAGAGNLADKAKAMWIDKTLKAIGAGKADYERLASKGMLEPLAQTAKDTGAVGWFSGPKTIASRLANAKEDAGQNLGSILDQVDTQATPKISARDLALELSQDPRISALSKVPGAEGTAKQVETFLDTLYKSGDELSLRDAQSLRQGIDRQINFSKLDPNMRGSQPFLKDMRDGIRDKMNDAVNGFDQTQGSGAADRLMNANKSYSNLSALNDMADDRVARQAANRAVGLTDTIAGSAGAGIGSEIGYHAAGIPGAKTGALVGGLVGGVGNKIARTVGPSFQANAADSMSLILNRFPKLAGAVQNNPAAQATLLSLLTRKNQAADEPYKNDDIRPELLDQYKRNPGLIDQITNPAWKAHVQKMLEQNKERSPADTPIMSQDQAQEMFKQGKGF